MSINLEGRSLSSILVDDSGRSFTETLVYELTAGETLFDISTLVPPIHARSAAYPGFRVKNASTDYIAGQGSNGVQVTINWHFPVIREEEDSEPDPNLPPWQWPIQNYSASSVETEESILHLWENGTKKSFRTTAGTELIGTCPRGLRQISFSYNLPNFNESTINNYIGKINQNEMTVASVSYDAKTVLMKNISATPCVVKNDDNSTKWRYYRIDVGFLVDVRTFEKEYPNMSTFCLDSEKRGLVQIWTGKIEGERHYGSLEYLTDRINQISDESARESLQSVTEPMFLNENGGISQLTGGTFPSGFTTQTPTYVTGSPYEPVDFTGLSLPSSKGRI